MIFWIRPWRSDGKDWEVKKWGMNRKVSSVQCGDGAVLRFRSFEMEPRILCAMDLLSRVDAGFAYKALNAAVPVVRFECNHFHFMSVGSIVRSTVFWRGGVTRVLIARPNTNNKKTKCRYRGSENCQACFGRRPYRDSRTKPCKQVSFIRSVLYSVINSHVKSWTWATLTSFDVFTNAVAAALNFVRVMIVALSRKLTRFPCSSQALYRPSHASSFRVPREPSMEAGIEWNPCNQSKLCKWVSLMLFCAWSMPYILPQERWSQIHWSASIWLLPKV